MTKPATPAEDAEPLPDRAAPASRPRTNPALWFCVVVGGLFGVAANLRGPLFFAVRWLLIGYVAVAAVQFFAFLYGLALLGGLVQRGETARAALWLGRLMAVPSLIGRSVKRWGRASLARLLAWEGRLEEAVDQMGLALRGHPTRGLLPLRAADEARLRDERARWLDALGRADEARSERAAADALLAQEGDSPAVACTRAERLVWANRLDEAAAVLDKALATLPPSDTSGQLAALMTQAVNVAVHRGRLHEALRRVGEYEALPAAAADATRAALGVTAASMLLELGRIAEAEDRARAALERPGINRLTAQVILARILIRAGRLDEATALLDQTDAERRGPRPDSADPRPLLDHLRGRHDQALASFRRQLDVLSRSPDHTRERLWTLVHLAEIEAEHGDPVAALEMLGTGEAAALGDPVHEPRFLAVSGYVLARLGEHDAARECLGRAERGRDTPGDYLRERARVRQVVGRAWLALGEPQEAVNWLREALDLGLEPSMRPSALVELGDALRQLGETDAARAPWSEAAAGGMGVAAEAVAAARLAGSDA